LELEVREVFVLRAALGVGVPSAYSKACNFPEVRVQRAGVELGGVSWLAGASCTIR
jgi:hypothetical protein